MLFGRIAEDDAVFGSWSLYVGGLDGLMEDLQAYRPRRAELVVTLNADHVAKLLSNGDFRKAYDSARWRTVDGTPLVWLLRALGVRNARRVTGVDLLSQASRSRHFAGRRIVVTGGSEAQLWAAVTQLRSRGSRADIVAVPFPMIEDPSDDCPEVLEALRSIIPDLVFVCLGSPKQELWVHHWRDSLPPAIYVGAGAAVAFAAGQERRAPGWLQRLGLEWAYRLAQDPRRLWRRYTREVVPVIPVVLRSLLQRLVRDFRPASRRP